MHDNAFGISISDKNLSLFHARANKDLSKYDFGEDVYEVNFKRHASDKDISDIIFDLQKYNFCWSQQNNEPLFYIDNIFLEKSELQVIGRNKDTLKFSKNGIAYLQFFAKNTIEKIKEINDKLNIEVIGKANLAEWGGHVTPQIFIESIDVKKDDILSF